MSSALGVLPPPRSPDSPYTVAMVCLGNICRSPTAEVVLSAKLASLGLGDRVSVISSGTGDWHLGGPMDERASATLTAAGYDASRHRAQQFDAGWIDRVDLVLVMDSANLRDVQAVASAPGAVATTETLDRVRRFREFDPAADADLDVADPFYGGIDGFHDLLSVVERTTDELVRQLQELLPGAPG
jgi:protein-tyrosine phosphatase